MSSFQDAYWDFINKQKEAEIKRLAEIERIKRQNDRMFNPVIPGTPSDPKVGDQRYNPYGLPNSMVPSQEELQRQIEAERVRRETNKLINEADDRLREIERRKQEYMRDVQKNGGLTGNDFTIPNPNKSNKQKEAEQRDAENRRKLVEDEMRVREARKQDELNRQIPGSISSDDLQKKLDEALKNRDKSTGNSSSPSSFDNTSEQFQRELERRQRTLGPVSDPSKYDDFLRQQNPEATRQRIEQEERKKWEEYQKREQDKKAGKPSTDIVNTEGNGTPSEIERRKIEALKEQQKLDKARDEYVKRELQKYRDLEQFTDEDARKWERLRQSDLMPDTVQQTYGGKGVKPIDIPASSNIKPFNRPNGFNYGNGNDYASGGGNPRNNKPNGGGSGLLGDFSPGALVPAGLDAIERAIGIGAMGWKAKNGQFSGDLPGINQPVNRKLPTGGMKTEGVKPALYSDSSQASGPKGKNGIGGTGTDKIDGKNNSSKGKYGNPVPSRDTERMPMGGGTDQALRELADTLATDRAIEAAGGKWKWNRLSEAEKSALENRERKKLVDDIINPTRWGKPDNKHWADGTPMDQKYGPSDPTESQKQDIQRSNFERWKRDFFKNFDSPTPEERKSWQKYWDDRDKGLFPPRPDGEPDDYRDPFAPIGPDPVPAPPSQPIVYAQIWARHDPGPGYEGALVWYSYIDVYPNAGEPSIRGDLGWDGLFLSHAAGHVSRIETAYRMRGDDTLIGNGPFFQGYGEEIPDEEFYRNKWGFKWTWDESTKLGHAYLGYPEQEEMYRLSFDQERFKRREKFQFPYGKPTQLKIVRYGPDNRPFTPPLPDDTKPFPEDDNDMACRYAEDQETPTALAYFNSVTGKKEYATKMTHKGVDDALSFLAEKMAELGEQVHSVVKATEADQYRQPAGKVAFPVAAMEVPQTILQGDFTKPFPVKSMPQEMALYNSMARVEQGRHLLGRLEMPSNPNISPDTQTNPMQRPKTMMGWMHKMYDNLSGQVGVPTPHKVMKSDGTFEEDSFRNSADIAETTHAKVSSLEQDISSLQEMLFKVIQQNEMLIQMVFKTDAKADFLIKDTGARITYEKATIPSVIQHGKPKDDAAKALFNWDKTFRQGDAHTTIPVWKGEIDKHQLLQKTNIQAQIAASSVFFPLAKDNKDSIPRLGKPKQSDTNWLSYVKSVNEPPENTPLQGSNIPQPKIELIDNGIARDINTSSASYLTK